MIKYYNSDVPRLPHGIGPGVVQSIRDEGGIGGVGSGVDEDVDMNEEGAPPEQPPPGSGIDSLPGSGINTGENTQTDFGDMTREARERQRAIEQFARERAEREAEYARNHAGGLRGSDAGKRAAPWQSPGVSDFTPFRDAMRDFNDDIAHATGTDDYRDPKSWFGVAQEFVNDIFQGASGAATDSLIGPEPMDEEL